MLNSRDISLLRSDVAANCKTFIQLCADAGYSVLVTGTVRDAEFQAQCYAKGTANTKVPSFHGVKAGLAFDICQNVKGKEYDSAFFAAVGRIGQQMGFEWGGSWKFTDKPHFQWSDGGKYTSSMIIAGKYPPTMPLYQTEEEDDFMKVVAQIAQNTGMTEDAVIASLSNIVGVMNVQNETWKAEGEKKLRTLGLTSAVHDPREPIQYWSFGVIIENLINLIKANKI
jgi:hypothetical protein